jgi:mycothiol synthase
MTDVRVSVPSDREAILAVMEAALEADRYPGITHDFIARSVDDLTTDPGGTWVALHADEIVGYVTPRHDDLTVHPAHRRRGHGSRLLDAGMAIVHERRLRELRLYVPEHLEPSVAFATARGFRRVSSYWLFRLRHDAVPGPAEFDDSVAVGPFEPADTGALVALMNESFVDHPTPVEWSAETIRSRVGTATFDPGDILLVRPGGTGRGADPARPVAFCQVRVTPDDDGSLVGEVALIGTLPAWRHRGLGGQLLRWGVDRCRTKGATTVELSVEAENERALVLYRAAGFEPAIEWPHWARSCTA